MTKGKVGASFQLCFLGRSFLVLNSLLYFSMAVVVEQVEEIVVAVF